MNIIQNNLLETFNNNPTRSKERKRSEFVKIMYVTFILF